MFYGDGKGKTSAALGVALRMAANNKRVIWISWFKSLKWNLSEAKLPKYMKNITMYWVGQGFYIKGKQKLKDANGAMIRDTATFANHKKAAKEGMLKAEEALNAKNKPELLILDEVLDAISERLITQKDLIDLLEKRGSTHVILTGHKITKKIYDQSDLVTRMKNEKHPYDKGTLAVKGLDF